ncbi:MAG: phosphoglycerate kinase [Desulfobacteraceae bacterium]|nr:MAG: phosphoglycerate kinase [Desulfobacteraceae bacterium]
MKTIRDVDLSGKRVFIRVDFNVPLDDNQKITDDTRIRFVVPTLKYAIDNNAKLIIASHLGRPKGKVAPKYSLAPVLKSLGSYLGKEVKMAPDCIGPEVTALVSSMSDGDVLLLENLRFHPQEESNDDAFGKELAQLCDIYVNDAFAVSHRANASVAAITEHAPVSVAGFLLEKELEYFEKAMMNPERPLVAVIGGAKVSSKLAALENIIQRVDKLLIGGAMANTFLKSRGIDVGGSKIEENLVEVAALIMNKACERGVKLYLPVDAVAADSFDPSAVTRIVPVNEIPSGWMVLDIGPATSLLFQEALNDARTIIWNGPLGAFEMDAFSRGTMSMVRDIANSQALTIVGGGDTDLAVHKAGEADKITFISTGGGAFLELLEGRTLPAVSALIKAGQKT